MKNTKSQTPNPRQTSNTNPKPAPLVEGWHDTSPASNKPEPWLLKDEPLKVSSTEPTVRHPFDLEERTALFGEGIVRFCNKVPRGPANNRLIDQLVGTSLSLTRIF